MICFQTTLIKFPSSLNTDLEDKSPVGHKHTAADITDMAQASVKYADSAGKVPWNGISGKPSSFPPSDHNHDDRYFKKTDSIESHDGFIRRIGLYQDSTGTYIFFRGTDGIDRLVSVDKTKNA